MTDYTELEKFDVSKMHNIYGDWPKMAKDAYEYDYGLEKFDKISHIVFIGMGGSGAIGDIFKSILSRTKIHVTVVKGYIIPNTVNNETLVVPISISGNTVEVLANLKTVIKLNAKILAFSSGGKLKDFCKKNNIQHKEISMIHSPRSSFVIFLFSMLKILKFILPIKETDVIDAIEKMNELKKNICYQNMNNQNLALQLAESITKIPIIYYPYGLEAAAIRFKNCLQENAKIHAFAEDVIEECHNGIVSWEKKSNFVPILIQGSDDHIKTKERWIILKKYFDTNSIQYLQIKSVNGGILSKIINLIYLLDYTSIYLALLLKTDPTPVKSIDFIKKNLT